MAKIVQPGGESGQRRVRYTARRKYSLLATARRLRLGGKSLNRAAAELHVSASNLSKWEKVGVGTMDPKDKLFKSKKMCSHPGPPGQLATIDEPLLRYVFEQREQGGLSYAEIAQLQQVPVGTVRSRIFRARETIALKLRPLLDTPEHKRW